MLPTKEHNNLAIRNKWSACQYQIFNFLLAKSNPNESTEIQFHTSKFQEKIKKQRGEGYHRTTIPKSIKQLVEERSEGLVVLQYEYGRGVYDFIVHPISFLRQEKISERESSLNQNRGNPMFSEEHKEREAKQQQLFISKADELLKGIGLNFDPDALNRIWRLSGKSIELVVKTIEHLLYRNGENPGSIKNPFGFVMRSLRCRWAQNFDLYYQPELPKLESKIEIEEFMTSLTQSILSPQASERLQT